MEWFRWYHGTVSDPKFSVIAKRSQQPRHVVIACWPAILEYSSTRADRGSLENIDCEEIAVVLDLETSQVEAVLQAMVDKGMIVDERLVNWEKRQPKREDTTGAERKERWKKKQKDAPERTGTQENAEQRTERARTEQNRAEQRREEEPSSSSLEEMPTRAPSPPEQKAMVTEKISLLEFREAYLKASGMPMKGGLNNHATQLCMKYPREKLEYAFEQMALHNGEKFSYLLKILENTGKNKPARASPSGPVSFEQAKSERTKLAAQAFVERKRAECQTTTTSFSGQSSPDLPRRLELSAVSIE